MLEVNKLSYKSGLRTVFVNELTNGVLDPAIPMLGPVADGGTIVANTAPGCWGPMITPEIRGGHEVHPSSRGSRRGGGRCDRNPHPFDRRHLGCYGVRQ